MIGNQQTWAGFIYYLTRISKISVDFTPKLITFTTLTEQDCTRTEMLRPLLSGDRLNHIPQTCSVRLCLDTHRAGWSHHQGGEAPWEELLGSGSSRVLPCSVISQNSQVPVVFLPAKLCLHPSWDGTQNDRLQALLGHQCHQKLQLPPIPPWTGLNAASASLPFHNSIRASHALWKLLGNCF